MNHFRTPLPATSVTMRHSSRSATTRRDTGFHAFLNFVHACKKFVASRRVVSEVSCRLHGCLALAVVCAASLYCVSSASAQTTNVVVTAWGTNDYGQCTIPASASSGVSAIAGGGIHTIAIAIALDANNNNRPDTCDMSDDPSLDRNANGIIDALEIARTPSIDCNRNSIIDAFDLLDHPEWDCNFNGRIDTCDFAEGASDDDLDGHLDDCEWAKGDLDLSGIVDSGDFSILLLYYGEENPSFGDFDGSGIIDTGDASIMLLYFGEVTWQ